MEHDFCYFSIARYFHMGKVGLGLSGRRSVGLFYRKSNALTRAGMAYLFSAPLSLYVVNEYPKSGGTWVGQMLGRALGVPFPRNRFPMLRSSIMHSHYLNPRGLSNVVLVWRDGRDIAVSWYYHCLFTNELENAPLVQKVRAEAPFQEYRNIYENLPAFIEYSFTRQSHPRFSWSDFVRRWHDREGVVHVSYEGFRAAAEGELRRAVGELTGENLDPDKARRIVEEFSFARQSGRSAGEGTSNRWMRKGVVGDWRNHFSPEARETFDYYAGEELVLLGYERDRSWVRDSDHDPAAKNEIR